MTREILDYYPLQNDTVVGRIVDGEAVIVLPGSGQVKVLNEIGARIWWLMDGAKTLRTIAEIICGEYQVEEEQAQIDVLEFIDRLEQVGIVKLVALPPDKGMAIEDELA